MHRFRQKSRAELIMHNTYYEQAVQGPVERSKYWGGNSLFRSIFIRFSKFFFSLKAVERAIIGGQAAPPCPPPSSAGPEMAMAKPQFPQTCFFFHLLIAFTFGPNYEKMIMARGKKILPRTHCVRMYF